MTDLHSTAAKWDNGPDPLTLTKDPDPQLVAAGQEACTDLHNSLRPPVVVTLMQREGWTWSDSAVIILSAAQPGSLCPDQYRTVMQSWMGSN